MITFISHVSASLGWALIAYLGTCFVWYFIVMDSGQHQNYEPEAMRYLGYIAFILTFLFTL